MLACARGFDVQVDDRMREFSILYIFSIRPLPTPNPYTPPNPSPIFFSLLVDEVLNRVVSIFIFSSLFYIVLARKRARTSGLVCFDWMESSVAWNKASWTERDSICVRGCRRLWACAREGIVLWA